MSDKSWHFLWGVGLLSLYVILRSIQMPMMRLCDTLRHSQTLTLIFVGDVFFTTPFAGVIWREWNLKTAKEWIVVGALCCSLAAYYAVVIVCAQYKHVGKLK